MMKVKIPLLLLLLATVAAKAQYNRLPVIPVKVYNVMDEGAVADGTTMNTQAIQKALDKARSSGGKVVIPAGEYLCGPLNMYGKTELEIAKGATLRLRNDIDRFPISNGRYLNFIDIGDANDVKISGGGTIDGQGEVWWKATEANSLKDRRPQMLFIGNGQRVEISGITFLNPPNTHMSLKDCNDVYIHDIIIQAPTNSHNTDGINISARNCTIAHCTINTGDDNIAINFGNKPAFGAEPEVKDIVIKDCTFGYGHGLSIGSFTSGSLSNLFVSKCTFDGTTSGIRIKTARGRGGVLDNVNYEEIIIKNSRYPIFISEYYPKEPKTPQEDITATQSDRKPNYKNISLKNIIVSNSQEALIIWGIPESPIEHVRLENVHISAKNGAQIYNAGQVEFINSSVIPESGERLRVYKANVTGLND